jgi:acyl CoA:acetate/3-ketoacid CoA transferase beta subunit
VDVLITDLAVFEFDKETRQMTLTEISNETTLDEVQAKTEAEYVVSPNLKTF